MAEHTPGPWSFIENSWDRVTVYSADQDIIAECPISSEVTEETQDEYEDLMISNAHLIAAAPELLAALESEHRSEFEGPNGCTSGRDCPTCALIAKAKGGSE